MPDNTQNPDQENFISRNEWIRKKRIYLSTIFSLTILVSVAVYIILLQEGVFGYIPEFRDPIKDADARAYIKKHRNSWVFREQTDVVTYDTADLGKYIREIYPYLITRMGNIDPNYSWQVGFYPMHRYDESGERRLDFAIIPTLMAKDSSHIIDFYTRQKSTRKLHNPKNMANYNMTCADCLAYDAGNIWP